MSSSTGNSLLAQIQNSGSEGDQKVLIIEQRKRKRMQSNRESARRSRLRKQQHLDDLTAQMTQLIKENNEIANNINIATQNHMNVEAKNSVLRAQMMELSQRLQSLNEMINYMNSCNEAAIQTMEINPANTNDCFINNSWNLMCLNQQPIMASSDMFQY